jgi:voltage-gated potassium channel
MINAANILKRADPFLKAIIFIGTGIYLWEISTQPKDPTQSHLSFVWIERFIAGVFTVEYFLRWMDDAQDHVGWHYPHSALGIVDLISILPFWVGIFIPADWIPFARTFRIFRLLKCFRYSRSLQLVALGFYRAWPALKPLCFSLLVIGLFCTVAIFEIESDAQPEKFVTLFDAAYFTMVTVATVGYGDLSPVTTLGRVITMFTFVSGLALFAGILGVLGASFFKVMEEEIDPNIDPIEEFKKERDRQLVRWPEVKPPTGANASQRTQQTS